MENIGESSWQAREFVRRVLVVEDDALLRALVSRAVSDAGFEVRAAADAITAKNITADFDPDVLLVDIDLGEGINGLELVSALSRENPSRGYVFLSNYSASTKNLPEHLNVSYLNKKELSNPDLIIAEIDSVLRGGGKRGMESRLASLTSAQIDVLQMISMGLSNAQIAAAKARSLRSVEQLLKRTYDALEIPEGDGRSRRVLAINKFNLHTGPIENVVTE